MEIVLAKEAKRITEDMQIRDTKVQRKISKLQKSIFVCLFSHFQY